MRLGETRHTVQGPAAMPARAANPRHIRTVAPAEGDDHERSKMRRERASARTEHDLVGSMRCRNDEALCAVAALGDVGELLAVLAVRFPGAGESSVQFEEDIRGFRVPIKFETHFKEPDALSAETLGRGANWPEVNARDPGKCALAHWLGRDCISNRPTLGRRVTARETEQ